MRVFLDTNVLVAAFATRGLCADLLRLVLVEHLLVVTPVVLDELRRVLGQKIGLPGHRVTAILDLLDSFLVEARDLGDSSAFGLRDASDEPVVASAIAARADLIVSGDRDLIEVELPIRVVTPRGLWEVLRGRE